MALTACTGEDLVNAISSDGALMLKAGVSNAPSAIATRANGSTHSLEVGTPVTVFASGKWNDSTVQRTTTYTAAVDGALSAATDKALYWDDFGSGDPRNTEGKEAGLKILSAAVEGSVAAPAIDDWNAATWTTTDGVVSGTKIMKSGKDKDLVYSNNLTALKFADRNTAAEMEMNHAMSKLTFVLTAGEGFANEFKTMPLVHLTSADKNADVENGDGAYALTTGAVNINKGTSTAEANAVVVEAREVSNNQNKVYTEEALVYPTTPLGKDANDIIAQINAGGNIYYITAEKIQTAMDEVSQTDHLTKAGYNYVFDVTIGKTGINLTATVSDWDVVIADEGKPIINLNSEIVGSKGAAVPTTFSSANYMSTVKARGYNKMDDGLNYWPSHDTHYFFRGISPKNTEITTDGAGNEVVAVSDGNNADLMIGAPEISKGTFCGSNDHTQVDMSESGVCARTSEINLNYRYMMAQVEVKLQTVESKAAVDLSNVTVDLTPIYHKANIALGSRKAIDHSGLSAYTLPTTTTAHDYLSTIVPQTIGDDAQFKITVKDDNGTQVYYANIKAVDSSISSWEGGKHYVYTLTLSKTAIKSTVTMTDWKTVEASTNVWF